MHHFDYRAGVLHAEAVDLTALADAVGTPFYCYSSATIERHYKVFAGAFADVDALVCYAMKANSNQAVIATLAKLGAGADVVSDGELLRARAAGVAAGQDHVLRRRQDRARARARGRREHSLRQRRIRAGARTARRRSPPPRAAPPTFRSASIPTSIRRPTPRSRPARPRTNSAFRSAAPAMSMPAPRSSRACASSASTCISAARSSSSIRSAMRSRCWPISSARCAPTATPFRHIDLGGGLGIPYREDNEPPPDPDAYAAIVKRATKNLGCKLIFEPGRLIVGNAGILVTRVHLCEARRSQDLRHRRCRHERSGPPDAL